jgi:hypothetical protein
METGPIALIENYRELKPKTLKHGGKEEAEEIRIGKSANSAKDRRNWRLALLAAFLAHEVFQFGFFGSFGNSGNYISPLPPSPPVFQGLFLSAFIRANPR